MHIFGTVLLGVIAFLWILEAVDLTPGVRSMPSLDDAPPLEDAACPPVSVLFAARDEADKLPHALDTFLALDYPRYEVVAVDDRSQDATGSILARSAQKDVLQLEHGHLPDPVARAINQLVEQINRMNVRVAEVEERQDCLEDKMGPNPNGAANGISQEPAPVTPQPEKTKS